MIVHAYYEEDPRVRREAESLVAAGRPVLVLSLKRPELPAEDVLQGVHVRRLDEQRHQGAALGTYLREYVSFLVRSGWTAVKLHRRHRFGLVQVHSLPDFLVFAALPLRLVGVPVVLDLHEAMPEFFVTRFPRAANPISHRLLLLQERLSMAFATHVITVNEAFGDRLRQLGLHDDKLSIVINSPSLGRFDAGRHPQRVFREDGMLKLVYTGALTPTYELDVTFHAIARIAAARPDLDVRLDLYGRGDSDEELRALAARADPDRRRAGRGGGRGHRHRPDAPRPVHRDDDLREDLRVRSDGQTGRRLAPPARGTHVPGRHRGHLRAGRRRGPRQRDRGTRGRPDPSRGGRGWQPGRGP
jgi:glycosyltransferase involved in cell wall biosynthesis